MKSHCMHAAPMLGSNMLMSGLQAVAACAQSIQHLQEVVTKAGQEKQSTQASSRRRRQQQQQQPQADL